MADNSVTIALKLDASQFNAGIAQAQASLNSMGMPGRGRIGSGRSTNDSGLVEQTKRTTKAMNSMTKNIENFMVRFTSMLRGNLAPSNVLGVVRSAQGIISGFTGGKTAASTGALAGIEGIGTEGATAAAASTAAAGGGGSIGAILGQLVGLVVGIAAVLALIAIGISALIVGVSAVSLAFKPILKILQAVGKVIGATLIPISMIIVTLLQPLIWLLLPFVRLMNVIFRPLRTALANFFKNAKTQFASGDILGILVGLFEAVKPALDGIVKTIGTMLMPLFNTLAAWIVGFLTINLSDIKNTLENLIGKELGGIVSTLINVLYYAVSAVTGFVAQLVGKDTFDNIFGKGKFDEIKNVNLGFKTGADIGAVLQSLWDVFTSFLGVLKGDPPDKLWASIGVLFGNIKTLANDVSLAFDGIIKSLPGEDLIKAGFQTIFTALDEFATIIKSAYVLAFGTDGTGGYWNKFKDATMIIVEAMVYAAGIIRAFSWSSTIDWIKEDIEKAKKDVRKNTGIVVGDAIITPSGQIIKTNPRDYIMASTNPTSLMGSGGNSTVININVEGNVDDKTARFITQTVQREIAQAWRSIAR